MTGLRELFRSGRGVLCAFLVVVATAFVLLGQLSVDAWISYTKWIAGFLVAGRTVTHAIERLTKPKEPTADPLPVATSPPS